MIMMQIPAGAVAGAHVDAQCIFLKLLHPCKQLRQGPAIKLHPLRSIFADALHQSVQLRQVLLALRSIQVKIV